MSQVDEILGIIKGTVGTDEHARQVFIAFHALQCLARRYEAALREYANPENWQLNQIREIKYPKSAPSYEWVDASRVWKGSQSGPDLAREALENKE